MEEELRRQQQLEQQRQWIQRQNIIDAQNTIAFNQNTPVTGLPSESNWGIPENGRGENMTPFYGDFIDPASEDNLLQPRFSNAYNNYGAIENRLPQQQYQPRSPTIDQPQDPQQIIRNAEIAQENRAGDSTTNPFAWSPTGPISDQVYAEAHPAPPKGPLGDYTVDMLIPLVEKAAKDVENGKLFLSSGGANIWEHAESKTSDLTFGAWDSVVSWFGDKVHDAQKAGIKLLDLINKSPEDRARFTALVSLLGPKGKQAFNQAIIDPIAPTARAEYRPWTDKLSINPAAFFHELAHAYDASFHTNKERAQFLRDTLELAKQGDAQALRGLQGYPGITRESEQAMDKNPDLYGGATDPAHLFTFFAEFGIPKGLQKYYTGLYANPQYTPYPGQTKDTLPAASGLWRADEAAAAWVAQPAFTPSAKTPPAPVAQLKATEPPPPPDLGIRSPGPSRTDSLHFGDLQAPTDYAQPRTAGGQDFAKGLPQPEGPTLLSLLNQLPVSASDKRQLMATAPYIRDRLRKGEPFTQIAQDVLGEAKNLGDPINVAFAGLATQVGRLPAISAPLSGGLGSGGVTSDVQVKDTDPVSQMIYQSIPALIAGEVLPAGIAERLFTAIGGVQGAQLAQDYKAGKISGTQAAIGLAQIAPQLAGIITKAGGLGRGLGESGMLASERGSIGTPPEPGKGLEPSPQSAPTTADEAALHVSEWLRKGEKARPEQQAMFDEQRAAQLQRMESVFQQNGPNAAADAKAAGAGGFDRPSLAPLELGPQHEAAIRSEINTSPMYDHAGQRIQATDALEAMQRGHLPQPAQAVELSKILGGPQFLDAFLKAAPINWSSEVLGALGIPQALQSSLDASAVLRQMAPLGWSNPKSYFDALGTIGRAFGSDEGALAVQRETEALPWVSRAPERGAEGLTYSALGGRMADIGAHLQESEGQFSAINRSVASRAVEKVPWVKPSERIYNAPINRLRGDVYSRFAQNMWDAGERNPKAYRAVVHVIEHATGWGTVEVGQIGRGLNAFYSPRNLTARFQVLLDPILQPGSLLKPSARQLAARNLVGFVGANAALLGAMGGGGALAGYMLGIPNPVHVELDPRSTDVWKGKIGNLRIDMTGGYGSIIRLAARLSPLLKGEAPQVKDINGLVRDASPADLLDQFIRGKMGPIPGAIYDALGFPGGEGYAADLRSKEGWRTFAFNMLTPFFVQDVVNAWREQGPMAAAIAAPVSFFGGSVNTYSTSEKQKQAMQVREFATKLKGARMEQGEVYPKVLDSDFKSPAWRDQFRKDFSELGDLSKYDSPTALRKAYVDYWATRSKLSRDEISAAFDKFPSAKLWAKNVQQEKLNWWKQNAALVDEARTNNALPSATILKAIGK